MPQKLSIYTNSHSDLFFLFQGPEMLPYQPNSESCLIGCYNTEEMEPKNFPRQVAKQHLCALFLP